MRNATRRNPAGVVGVSHWGSPKSMMDNSRPNQGVVVYAGLDDVTIQPELCYGGAVAGESQGQSQW